MKRLDWLLNAIATHDSDACLLWPFCTNNYGYGQLYYGGRMIQVHRLAFYLTHSRWPTPFGCHSCDTPGCFNARHIFEGTQADNLADARKKHRLLFNLSNLRPVFGEENGKSRLTEESIKQIRAEYVRSKGGPGGKCGFGAPPLAKKFGVSETAIRLIVNRRRWRHVA